MAGLLQVAKVGFLLALIVGHFFAFGLPYLQKYLDHSIGVQEKREKSTALKPPAITFCPYEANLVGWKNATDMNVTQNLRLRCDEVPTTSDGFLSCIEEKTYELRETIEDARHGYLPPNKNLSNSEFWSWDMSVSVAGRCYTINYNQSLPGLDVLEDGLFFDLKQDLQYMIFLHEPEFFSITYNGMTMPTTMLFLKQPKDAVQSYTNILLEVTSLNCETQPPASIALWRKPLRNLELRVLYLCSHFLGYEFFQIENI